MEAARTRVGLGGDRPPLARTRARPRGVNDLGGSVGPDSRLHPLGDPGSIWDCLRSPEGFTAVSHIFVMEWAAVLRDVALGLLIAGAVGAWVPNTFWRHFFFTGHPLAAKIWGPLVGPLVAVVSFV